ncbi:MAG: Flp family type IVb pilin [Alphaproteobacteria bacterium]
MRTLVAHFIGDDVAAVSVEYALIAGLVSVAIIAGAIVVGTQLDASFASIATYLQ